MELAARLSREERRRLAEFAPDSDSSGAGTQQRLPLPGDVSGLPVPDEFLVRHRDLLVERFGPPPSPTEICMRCGAELKRNAANFPVHVHPKECAVPTVAVVERRA
jgi:hypothetical protein